MKILRKIIKAMLIALLAVVIYAVGVNIYVLIYAKKHIVTPENPGSGYDCILVLGCSAKGGKPSDMLRDRLDRAVELYKSGVSDRILMSGDHGTEYYDEVNVMKQYAVENGVPAENIFLDHAGFSTYESMYRASYIFECKKIIIVTQKYHLSRAVFDARRLGIDASGITAMPNTYRYMLYNNAREFVARNKDFIFTLFKPEPTYLGEKIPISGSAGLTDG